MAHKPTKASGGQARQRRAPGDNRRQVLAGWGTGLAMGLFVALLVHLEHTRPAEEPAREAGESAPGEVTAGSDDGPRFEFYRLLSEQEVDITADRQPDSTASSALPSAEEQDRSPPAADAGADPAESTARASSDAAPEGRRYLLQAGSFRAHSDAEALRASLALLGIEARVQQVELPGGETWHRVRIGPFDNLEAVNSVRERMASREIDSILLRAGG
ncbi:hypothetical protein GJ672_01235 [Spiribacter sp. 2438]|uniref:SPOR domain-containing protein n=1 Tax=Spiribacter sp. 2438 TaxID=2666185 RepID=UPI0012B12098|nr:SPOR domain-containing protein [Spiribacter sp. 2438]QGM21033.1 hypothetical protein GJ672_01235 [Spiribacter sp. 2438]